MIRLPKKFKKYLKYVRLDEDGETILIKNLGDDFSRFGIFGPVPDVTAGTTAYHLLFQVMLQFERPNVIRFDHRPCLLLKLFNESFKWKEL